MLSRKYIVDAPRCPNGRSSTRITEHDASDSESHMVSLHVVMEKEMQLVTKQGVPRLSCGNLGRRDPGTICVIDRTLCMRDLECLTRRDILRQASLLFTPSAVKDSLFNLVQHCARDQYPV